MNARIVLLSILLIALSCSHKQSTPLPTEESFYFTGQVTDSNGAPVPGAAVFAQAKVLSFVLVTTRDLGSDTTDNNGRYKIKPLKTDIFTGADPMRCVYDVTATKGQLYAVESFNNDTVRVNASPAFVVNLRFPRQ